MTDRPWVTIGAAALAAFFVGRACGHREASEAFKRSGPEPMSPAIPVPPDQLQAMLDLVPEVPK